MAVANKLFLLFFKIHCAHSPKHFFMIWNFILFFLFNYWVTVDLLKLTFWTNSTLGNLDLPMPRMWEILQKRTWNADQNQDISCFNYAVILCSYTILHSGGNKENLINQLDSDSDHLKLWNMRLKFCIL